ncbi:unnamed protein product [Staurois parvus]|uniref:Uncharacterized protein n=1 Tax=Staurois parvus TaxID=386267 RepID=A0ABN9CDW9_9NEOB|nr:unnamed protein product [Staurois parvus]
MIPYCPGGPMSCQSAPGYFAQSNSFSHPQICLLNVAGYSRK